MFSLPLLHKSLQDLLHGAHTAISMRQYIFLRSHLLCRTALIKNITIIFGKQRPAEHCPTMGLHSG